MSGWFTDENGELHRFAGGSGFKSALPVGAVFASALPLTDSSVHALDGTTISQTGIYEQFAVYLKSLRDAGYNITCDQDDFDASVSTYGQCGKFVINDNNNTIRLPKVTKFIEGLSDMTKIGSFNEAGLPNIEGDFDVTAAGSGAGYPWDYSGSAGEFTGAFKNPTKATGLRYISSTSSTTTNPVITKYNFNANDSNDIYGSSDTVQPESISYPYYIVLISGFDPNVIGGGSGGTGGSKVIWEVWE